MIISFFKMFLSPLITKHNNVLHNSVFPKKKATACMTKEKYLYDVLQRINKVI